MHKGGAVIYRGGHELLGLRVDFDAILVLADFGPICVISGDPAFTEVIHARK